MDKFRGFTASFGKLPELLRDIGEATKNLQDTEQLKAIENIFGKGTGQELLTMIRSMSDGAYEHFNKIADCKII